MIYTKELLDFTEMDLIRIYDEELKDALKWMDGRDMGPATRKIVCGVLYAMKSSSVSKGFYPVVDISQDSWKAFLGPNGKTSVAAMVFEVHKGQTNAKMSNVFRPRGGLKEISKRYVWNRERFYARMAKLSKPKPIEP